MTNVVGFAYVKNEEKNISKVIENLQKQTLSLIRIILVNDGSTDRTSEIAKKMGVEVIDLPNEEKDKRGTPELSKLRNVALSKLDNQYDYVLHFGGDHLFPPRYVEIITKEMNSNPKLGICSGFIKGSKEKRIEPPGSGRIVRFTILKAMNLQYPIKYGGEAYILYKSLQLGFENKIFDIETTILRPTRLTYSKEQYVGYGRAAKALGYSPLFFIGKLIIESKKSVKGAFYQLKGFLDSNVELHDKEIRQLVRKRQNERMKRIFTKN